jgi:hypothetical protein
MNTLSDNIPYEETMALMDNRFWSIQKESTNRSEKAHYHHHAE